MEEVLGSIPRTDRCGGVGRRPSRAGVESLRMRWEGPAVGNHCAGLCARVVKGYVSKTYGVCRVGSNPATVDEKETFLLRCDALDAAATDAAQE